jgi:transposase-like protein
MTDKTPSNKFRDRVGWTCPRCSYRIYDIRHATQKQCPYCNSKDVTRDGYQMTENGYQMRYACRHCRRHFILDHERPATAAVLEKIQELKNIGTAEFTTKDIAKTLTKQYAETHVRNAITALYKAGLLEHIGYARIGMTNSTRYQLKEMNLEEVN